MNGLLQEEKEKRYMEKYKIMKKIISFFILFISFSTTYAQNSRIITPTKGEIVFREFTKITNRDLFVKSLKNSKEKFKQSLKQSFIRDSINKDKVQQIEEMVKSTADAMEYIFKEDSTEIYQCKFNELMEQSFSENVILKISVNKKSRKIINGYDCFKVMYQYKENTDTADEDYLTFTANTIYQREMWVTEKIKSLHHPVIFDKSILEKYYPLAIVETQNDIEGFERNYILETLTVN